MLAGYLAASFTKTGKLGTYARPGVPRNHPLHGRPVRRHPVLQPAEEARDPGHADRLGRRRGSHEDGTLVGGSGGNDTWNNPTKGKQFAQTFLDNGVDIVHPVAGGTGNGTIEAMHTAGKWAIGVDTDQYICIGPPTNARS